MFLNVSFPIAVFIFGLIVGSFLNCVIYRLQTDESFLRGRSFCPRCGHTLSWWDLIPVFSFLILRDKCRYCQKPISFQYPLVELLTGLIFVLILNYELGIMNYDFLNFNFILYSLFLILISCFLIIIFVYDLKHYIIPDKIIYPAIIIALIFNLQFLLSKQLQPSGENLLGLVIFKNSILSALVAALFFLLIVLISRGRWMGVGDIKLAFLMGLFLAFPKILVALFLAFFIGAIIGIGLIIAGKKKMKSEVPFGPFLVAGTFLSLFFGEQIFSLYLHFLI